MKERKCESCGIQTGRHYLAKLCIDCAMSRIKKRAALSSVAHRLVALEIKAGRLARAKDCACVDCGRPAQVYEHRDYAQPLQVDPVCRRCNAKRGAGHPYDGHAKGWAARALLFKENGR